MAYGVVLNFLNKDVLVVGAGAVGFRKTMGLLVEGARVRVLALDFVEELENLQEQHRERLIFIREAYHTDHLDETDLVVAATSDGELNRQIREDCRKRWIWCNNTSDLEQSDFSNMTCIQRSSMAFFASSQGGSPGWTARVLEELVNGLDEALLAHLEEYARVRHYIRTHVKSLVQRQKLLQDLKETPLSELERWRSVKMEGENHDHQSRE